MNVPKLIDELERDEGLRLRPYQDSVGKWTIGIGRNLSDRGITKAEAYHLLNNDIDDVLGELDHFLPWWRRLDDTRQRVIANMGFNLGVQRLMTFEHFLAHMMIGEYQAAADDMLDSLWAKQVGKRAERLAMMVRIGLSEETDGPGNS